MQPASTTVCMLTGVAGRYQGDGERVEVTVDSASGYWVLSGRSQQTGVSARAECFLKSCVWANGSSFWSSDEFTTENFTSNQPVTTSTATWWGDAFTFMTGFGGKLDSPAHWAGIGQSASAYSASNVFAYVNGNAPLWVAAHSFFAGTPSSGKPAKFIGPAGTGTIGVAGTYNARSGNPDLTLAPQWSAMCGLTTVWGQFLSAGDQASIYAGYDSNGNAVWKLHVGSTSGFQLQAGATCYALNQL
jgi:hypothetical protein